MDCRGCRYYKNLADNHCIGCDGSRYTKPSNADRIRSMTDEELAELLVSTDGDFPPNCEGVPVRKLEAYWLDWLKREVNDG